MIKGLWNHAIKVEDLDDATRFYVETLGAELRYASTVLGCDYRLIRLGDARILLFDRAPYEHLLDEPLPPGLLHTVYEVDDLDAQVERLRASGCRILMEPTEIESDFGVRRICFFIGPGGVRTEVTCRSEPYRRSTRRFLLTLLPGLPYIADTGVFRTPPVRGKNTSSPVSVPICRGYLLPARQADTRVFRRSHDRLKEVPCRPCLPVPIYAISGCRRKRC